MIEEQLLLTIAAVIRRGRLTNRVRVLLMVLLYFVMRQLRERYDSDSSSSSSDEEELHVLPPSQSQKKKRRAAGASSSSSDSPTLSLGTGDIDIVDNHIKEEAFSDTEESPAKRLKIEPYDISETHVEESKLIPVKIEPLDNHLSNIVRDLCEPAVLNNHSFVLKQEPLDINESSSINSPQPGTSGVTVKSEPDDTDSPNNVNFSAVYLPEETDARIKQEIELPPDDL